MLYPGHVLSVDINAPHHMNHSGTVLWGLSTLLIYRGEPPLCTIAACLLRPTGQSGALLLEPKNRPNVRLQICCFRTGSLADEKLTHVTERVKHFVLRHWMEDSSIGFDTLAVTLKKTLQTSRFSKLLTLMPYGQVRQAPTVVPARLREK